MSNDMMMQFQRAMYDTAAALREQYPDKMGDFLLINRDTAARLLSVIYLSPGDERIVLSPKLQNDVRYMQRTYGVSGGEVPDAEVVTLIQQYTRELK